MFWKLSGDAFWVLTRFCSSKTDRVTNFWLSGILSGQFGKNLGFWLTHFFDQLIFWQLIYVTTDFLTTKFCDSLSNYLTYLLRVWDSRPLVLFCHSRQTSLPLKVAQKLTKLWFFGRHQLLAAVIHIAIAETLCWRLVW